MKNIKLAVVLLSLYCVSQVFSFTYTYNTNTPLGSDLPSVIDDRIREAKQATTERLDVDHFWALTGSEVSGSDTGQHRFITFHMSRVGPAAVAENHGYLGIKDFDSKAELIWIDEDENEIQLTKQGASYSSGSQTIEGAATFMSTVSIVGALNPSSYSTDNTGFLDEDDMASDSATAVVSQQSIKKYADDLSGLINVRGYVTGRNTNGAATVPASTGITGVNRDSTGVYTITFTSNFSANYVFLVTSYYELGNNTLTNNPSIFTENVGSIVIKFHNAAGELKDPHAFTFIGMDS